MELLVDNVILRKYFKTLYEDITEIYRREEWVTAETCPHLADWLRWRKTTTNNGGSCNSRGAGASTCG